MAPAEGALTSTEPGPPNPDAGSAAAPPAPPVGQGRLVGGATVAAWFALALLAVAVGLALWPVRNGDVQDCGVPFAFLVTGRQDTAPTVGPDGAPPSAVEVERVLDRPCRERVAERMVPAGLCWVGGLGLGLVALVATMVGRRRLRRRLGPGTMAPDG